MWSCASQRGVGEGRQDWVPCLERLGYQCES